MVCKTITIAMRKSKQIYRTPEYICLLDALTVLDVTDTLKVPFMVQFGQSRKETPFNSAFKIEEVRFG